MFSTILVTNIQETDLSSGCKNPPISLKDLIAVGFNFLLQSHCETKKTQFLSEVFLVEGSAYDRSMGQVLSVMFAQGIPKSVRVDSN